MKHTSLKILLIILLFTGICKAQTYPITISEEGFIFVEVSLNDSVKSNFVLDTGAGIVVVSNKLFQKLDGSLDRLSVGTGFRSLGDRVDLPTYLLPSISIGDYKKEDMKIGVFPMLDDYGIEGLISLKMFENQPFTIDFKNSKLILNSRSEIENMSGDRIPVKFNRMTDLVLDMFIPVCLNDSITLDAEFDTGSGYITLYINSYFIDKLGLDPASLTPTGDGMDGVISNVSICGSDVSVQNKSAQFKDKLIYEGLIGSAIFKDKILTIDIPGEQIIVKD